MDRAGRLLGEGVMGFLSRLFGQDSEDALSVPAMDGVFKPNTLLETARPVLSLPAVDNLANGPDALYCSSENEVFRIDPATGDAGSVRKFDTPVTMIAASASGLLAVAATGTGVELLENGIWRSLDLPDDCASCVTAGLFTGTDDLYLAIGSRQRSANEWKRDLISHGSSGALVHCRLSAGTHEIFKEGLAFPQGLAAMADGRLAVSESWRHRILTVVPGSSPADEIVLGDLPAYPARIAPAANGGFWLALFAPRRQLTEFVLREDDYRREMMATIAPEAWIGPDFAGNGSGEQPLQAGSVRQMGIMKPWAPSRSYGLVVKLDPDMQPVASFHSRADGTRHGIASAVEFEGRLYAASRGSGTLLCVDIGSEAS
jgi:hypothetical protein